MDEQMTRIGANEAARIAGCSVRKIQKMIKSGTLSAYREEGGKYLIDKSEFYRVFSEKMPRTDANNVRDPFALELDLLREQNLFLKEQLQQALEEKKVLIKTLESTQRVLEYKPKRRKLLGIF